MSTHKRNLSKTDEKMIIYFEFWYTFIIISEKAVSNEW